MTMEEPIFSRPSALFVGAHPDDIEIGAAGTVAKLAHSGWDIGYCVLTTELDPSISRVRSKEATEAAGILGVPPERIILLDFPDSHLEVTGETVGKLRGALEECGFDPDIVFTHTHSDSHNDHRAAYELVLATFRKKPVLSFAVVNSLIRSEFKPKVFVETSQQAVKKRDALRAHRSQGMRIDEAAIDDLNGSFLPEGGFNKAEPFELVLQEGAETLLYMVLGLNDSPFHNFWYPLLHEQPLLVIHSVPVYRRKRDHRWSSSKEQEGVELLYESFAKMWYEQNPVTSKNSDNPAVENHLYTSNVLLSGSAASNQFIRTYFDHFQGLRYFIDYSMPDYKDLAIVDKLTGEKGYAQYLDDGFGTSTLKQDSGILTIMKNPMHTTRTFFGCMGIHGFGTLGCFKVLCKHDLLRELLSIIDLPLQNKGFQVIIDHDVQENEIHIKYDSLHIIPEE